jgi:hypothetical protein
MVPLRPADHLPALAVSDIRDRTGIDHIDIRILIKSHDGKPRIPQGRTHGIGLIFIYLAAKRMQSCPFSIKSHSGHLILIVVSPPPEASLWVRRDLHL